MKAFRSLLFWSHLICGVVAGVVILIMSVTGAALTYQRQMQYWADTRYFRAAPVAGAATLPAADLIGAARAATSDAQAAATIAFRADTSLPVAVALGNRTVYVNPYTAQVYGEGRGQSMRAFFSSMTSWHRYLALSGDRRTTGRALTGASNLMFLFIVLSGMYLWWPRSLTWTQIRNVTWFRRRLPGKARDFNWHNVIGFWSALPLALVVYSGVVISYPWASNMVYTMVGEAPPAPAGGARAGGPGGAPAGPGREGGGATVDLDLLLARAKQYDAEWNILTLRIPAPGASTTTATVDRGDGGQPQSRGTLTMDARTGETKGWEGFSSLSLGRRLRNLLRFAHTGEAAGLTGQTIAGVVSAGGAVLVYTGIALSIRRLWLWLDRRRRASLRAPHAA